MTARRRFTGEFKARVALEALRGDKTVQEIASKHKVHPNQVSSWKRQAIDAFQSGARKGAYWGIRTNIADYGLPDAMTAPYDRTLGLAEHPLVELERAELAIDEVIRAFEVWGIQGDRPAATAKTIAVPRNTSAAGVTVAGTPQAGKPACGGSLRAGYGAGIGRLAASMLVRDSSRCRSGSAEVRNAVRA